MRQLKVSGILGLAMPFQRIGQMNRVDWAQIGLTYLMDQNYRNELDIIHRAED